ncbi:MAG: CDP-diacylglycerol--serine O-phosphatidyltransferase [Desulfobacteraceae bacterium]|nr:MAG: CDP-diacylglycerol--serine O-phosphatidyltransferase [Desulfobacteraceae bacterium]
MKSRQKNSAKKTVKKGIYILPNLFTSASLFGGFYAIIAGIQGRYEAAAIAILISCVLDALDGKIARFTRATSHFGIEYDSLSDLVAFGVAPGVLAFQWALAPFGRLGWLASFMYVICGALRLARFNVQKGKVDARYFKGLPIPAAASFIASLILFSNAIGGLLPGSKHILIIMLIYVLSFLMVSTINYPSFKELELRKQKPFNVLVAIILILIVIAYQPKIMLFFILVIYILSGPAVTIYLSQKKLARDNRHFKKFLPDNTHDVEEADAPQTDL